MTMVMVMMMMMMIVVKVVKVNLVITVVVVEEELASSIFWVKTIATGCYGTWLSICQNTQYQKPEENSENLDLFEITKSHTSLNDHNYHTFYRLDYLAHCKWIGPCVDKPTRCNTSYK